MEVRMRGADIQRPRLGLSCLLLLFYWLQLWGMLKTKPSNSNLNHSSHGFKSFKPWFTYWGKMVQRFRKRPLQYLNWGLWLCHIKHPENTKPDGEMDLSSSCAVSFQFLPLITHKVILHDCTLWLRSHKIWVHSWFGYSEHHEEEVKLENEA